MHGLAYINSHVKDVVTEPQIPAESEILLQKGHSELGDADRTGKGLSHQPLIRH